MSFADAPTPGRLVDYAHPDGQTSPAVIAELLDPDSLTVRLAVPPHIADGCIPAVPYANQLTYGHWSYRPRVKSSKIPLINPYKTALESQHWFSASQLKIWLDCPRQWGFKFLDKLPGQNRFAARGDAMHGFLHGWLAYGIPPPEDVREARLARAGIAGKQNRKGQTLIAYLPLPNTAIVEQRVNYISRGGYIYNLSLDFEFNEAFEQRTIRVIGDHKSTTDFKWALTEDALVDGVFTEGTLRNDIQGLIYAGRALSDSRLNEVLLRWLYYKDDKKRPSCRRVEARMTRSEVEQKFARIDAISQDIQLHGLTKKTAVELPACASSCHAKGGCPYLEVCPISDAERLEARMEQSSLRERLMKGSSNGASTPKPDPAIAAASAAPKAGATVATGAGATSAMDRLKAKTAGSAVKAPEAVAPAGAAAPKAPAAAGAAPKPAPATPAATTAAPAGGLTLAQKLKAKADAAAAEAVALASAAAAHAQAEAEAAQAEADAAAAAEEEAAQQAALEANEAVEEAATAPESIEDEAVEHNPADVNPPEQPAELIQDADQLAASNEAALPPKPTKAGRPKGAATVKPVSDEGHIYAAVFCQVLGMLTTAPDLGLDPETVAGTAVKGFRGLLKELGKDKSE